MCERLPLTIDEILRISARHADHEHFKTVVMPRLLIWNRVKETCLFGGELNWTFRWSPSNVGQNEIAISLPDKKQEFHFYYAVPLMLGLKVLLYLGDNTFNFFEAFPLMVKNGVVGEKEFTVSATLNSLPCLVLTKQGANYPSSMLSQVVEQGYSWQGNTQIVTAMVDGFFQRFNAPLMHIVDGKWRL